MRHNVDYPQPGRIVMDSIAEAALSTSAARMLAAAAKAYSTVAAAAKAYSTVVSAAEA
ncbi:MAG: hypothetical protein ABIQ99_07575 [Thermoflexales bacterium]